jgi:hypothetical protein
LLVQVNVTGTDPDTAFTLYASGPGFLGCGWPEQYGCDGAPLSAGPSAFQVVPGDYRIVLEDIATHCLVTDGLERVVSLGSRQTVNVTFSVDCGAAASTLRVSATMAGELLPSFLWVVYSNGNCLYCSESLLPGQSRDISVGPGPQQVFLSPNLGNCLVQPNPVEASVSAGAVLELGFAVLCTYWGWVDVSATAQGANVDTSFLIEGSVVGSKYDGWPLGLDRQPVWWDPISLRLPAAQSYRFLLSDIAANCRVLGDNPATVTVGSEITTQLNFSVICE